ncbi:MAG: recombinase family protein [Eubacteriales bacterium]
MIYGYARCSTSESRQDIGRQVTELKSLGAVDETIFLEYASGTDLERKELGKLLYTIKEKDIIVCTEVSRITRSTKQLCDLIDLIKNRQLKLVIKDSITIDCTNGDLDPMTKAFLQIAGVFSELERNMIRQRVKSGMKNAIAKGKTIGRPKTNANTIPNIFYKYYPQYKNRRINLSEFARLSDLSRTSIYKYLKVLNCSQ